MNLTPLLTSFVLVFLAELGDKTLYTVLLLSARNRALPVLIGACAAFVVQGIIAVGLGSLLALLPAKWIQWLTAAIFLFFGLLLLFKEESHPVQRTNKTSHAGRVMLTTFGLVFAAEWGDATQLDPRPWWLGFGPRFRCSLAPPWVCGWERPWQCW